MAKKRKTTQIQKQKRKNRSASKRQKIYFKRSAASKKGWNTRRRNFRKRSLASKKGWRRRKAKAAILARAKAKPKAKRGRLGEWLVTWIYNAHEGPPRQVDFTVIARNSNDALLFVVKAVANGEDSEGANLTWMEKIPWDETFAVEAENGQIDKAEIKKLGEGYVAVN